MANPLSGSLGNQNGVKTNNAFGLIQKFQQFKKNFKGDPKQQIQELLNSGKMTQEQLEEYMQMARQFQGLLGR